MLFSSIVLVFASIAKTVESSYNQDWSSNYNIIVERRESGYCEELNNPSFGRIVDSNINWSMRQKAVNEEFLGVKPAVQVNLDEQAIQELPMDSVQKLENSVIVLSHKIALCDATKFIPNKGVNCKETCATCYPGSLAICFKRHANIDFGRTCVCTYNAENPIQGGVVSLRSIF